MISRARNRISKWAIDPISLRGNRMIGALILTTPEGVTARSVKSELMI